MKPYLQVLQDRATSSENSEKNAVNRSSLIVPIIDGFNAQISFLNHFYIKRGYKDVSLKITPYDKNGDPKESTSHQINKPIVYTFDLPRNIRNSQDIAGCYELEFFCSKNLFVPFPAVMINHISTECINIVHSFNRNLNDLREYQKISNKVTREASFEYINNDQYETFIVFQRGLASIDIDDKLKFELYTSESKEKNPIWQSMLNINHLNHSTSHFMRVGTIFKNIPKSNSKNQYFLKIQQPNQFMFYGRLLAGIASKEVKAISANHSYYDTSQDDEYFQQGESFRTYPYNRCGLTEIIIYPITAPTSGEVSILANEMKLGKIKPKCIMTFKFGEITEIRHINITKLVEKASLTDVQTFSVLFKPALGYKTPARFSHQLCYGVSEKNLTSSINVTLNNVHGLPASNKPSQAWIQIINDDDYFTQTWLCLNEIVDKRSPKSAQIDLSIYDSTGLIKTKCIEINAGEALEIFNNVGSNDKYLWALAKSSKNIPFKMYTCHTSKLSGHSSGEHSF